MRGWGRRCTKAPLSVGTAWQGIRALSDFTAYNFTVPELGKLVFRNCQPYYILIKKLFKNVDKIQKYPYDTN